MKKILYIEDDPVSMILITKIVDKMGHQIIPALNSEEGIAKAYAYKPDLILMDIFLPGVDGLETTMHIRSSDKLSHIPVIAITAGQSPGDQELAMAAGCDGFLTKPVDVNRFVNYITEYLDGKVQIRNTFDPKEENIGLKKFSQRLVQRLTDKIHELSHANAELEIANRTLDKLVKDVRDNNSDLLQFNYAANQILTISGREKLYQYLPNLICDQLNMVSAAVYVVNEKQMTLDMYSHCRVKQQPESDHIGFVQPPFFDIVYFQEPYLFDPHWTQAAQKVDETMVSKLAPIKESFQSQVVYFLPIIGRPAGHSGFDCQNQDCQAFTNQDLNWWNKQIHNLDRQGLYFETQLRQVSEFYFNCCLYRLKGVLALGIQQDRLDETFRQMVQSFVRTVGLTIENIQLYDDVKDSYLQAEKQAVTDGLTGIYNYRHFQHQLEREIKRSKRHWSKASLIMMDIDFFKSYNDQNGHPAGDQVLRRLSEILNTCTRTSDVLARYGGEEFVLILPETPKPAAIKLAEKIRTLIQDEIFPHEKTQPNGDLTVSLGVATFPDDAQTWEELVQKADEQLYASKQSGRNKVSFA